MVKKKEKRKQIIINVYYVDVENKSCEHSVTRQQICYIRLNEKQDKNFVGLHLLEISICKIYLNIGKCKRNVICGNELGCFFSTVLLFFIVIYHYFLVHYGLFHFFAQQDLVCAMLFNGGMFLFFLLILVLFKVFLYWGVTALQCWASPSCAQSAPLSDLPSHAPQLPIPTPLRHRRAPSWAPCALEAS